MFRRELLYVFAVSIAVVATPFTAAHADFLTKAKAACSGCRGSKLLPART